MSDDKLKMRHYLQASREVNELRMFGVGENLAVESLLKAAWLGLPFEDLLEHVKQHGTLPDVLEQAVLLDELGEVMA